MEYLPRHPHLKPGGCLPTSQHVSQHPPCQDVHAPRASVPDRCFAQLPVWKTFKGAQPGLRFFSALPRGWVFWERLYNALQNRQRAGEIPFLGPAVGYAALMDGGHCDFWIFHVAPHLNTLGI